MKTLKTIFIILIITTLSASAADTQGLYTYNKTKTDSVMNTINETNVAIYRTSGLTNPYSINETMVPGNFPTFWFTFIVSTITTYTLYLAGVGVVTVGIIYIATDGDKQELKKAALGCLTGMIAGGALKYAMLELKSK